MPVIVTVLGQNPQQFLTQQNALDLVLHAGIVAKVVLGILLLFSIISWGIIIDKLRVFRRVRKQSDRFLVLFQQRKSVREIFQASRQYARNPFAEVFKEAYWLFNRSDDHASSPAVGGTIDMMREQRTRTSHTSDDLVRLFDSVASREVLALEKNLTFLATTGSVSPFFGLFGTVWGVMTAFMAIGFTGSADLSVVAPGIAEALITTAAGLGAAIPAVIAYNSFVGKLERLSAELEIFYSNLIEAFAKAEGHEVR
ncbi:MAG: MotA/TolQ/ExbB proton channel family protein [bacterium]